MSEKLTDEEFAVLGILAQREGGAFIRGEGGRKAVLALADRRPPLVCDPHSDGDALFTRITPAGRSALGE